MTDTPMTHDRSVDPMALLTNQHRGVVKQTRGRKRFNSGEHVWLGGRGALNALAELRGRQYDLSDELVEAIPRGDGKEVLQYGELVALSGDFYASPDELFDEKPSLVPWLWEDHDLSDLRAIFEKELQWIRMPPADRTSSYPDENIRMAWNSKGYLELALQNTDHFGWHNIRAYCRHHAVALELARSARGKKDETFRRALYTNAFADHFLTDAFAAGHIRVPRAEIRSWAAPLGFSEKVAGVLSKILHDQDGHVDLTTLHGKFDESQRAATDGLEVQDSTGKTWVTYCDGQLFLFDGAATSLAVTRPVAAVAASVRELILAWQDGDLSRTYEATQFAPFPTARTPKLIDKFSAAMPKADKDRLWEAVGWYAKIPWVGGFEQKHVDALLESLPSLMASFRTNVAAAIASEPDVFKTVSGRYLDAFRAIA